MLAREDPNDEERRDRLSMEGPVGPGGKEAFDRGDGI